MKKLIFTLLMPLFTAIFPFVFLYAIWSGKIDKVL